MEQQSTSASTKDGHAIPASQPSALDQVNVRRALLHVQEAIALATQEFTFHNGLEAKQAAQKTIKPLIEDFLNDLRGKGAIGTITPGPADNPYNIQSDNFESYELTKNFRRRRALEHVLTIQYEQHRNILRIRMPWRLAKRKIRNILEQEQHRTRMTYSMYPVLPQQRIQLRVVLTPAVLEGVVPE